MSNRTEAQGETNFWSYSRLALAGLAFAAVVAAFSCSSSAPPSPPVAGTRELSDEILKTEILDLDGKTFRLSDYRGKIVVLDLWATWCGPCREEIPHLVRLSEEYGGRGVEVVGLSIEDPSYNVRAVRDFARQYKINYRLGWAAEDWFLKLTEGRGSIPHTFFIGRDGRVYTHLRGYSPRITEQLRKALDRATQ